MKVLFIQPNIRRYRADLFDLLAEKCNWNITVLHFGEDESLKEHRFRRVKLNSGIANLKNSFRFVMQHARENDALVCVFDIHYWAALFACISQSRSKKVIFWGHGLGRRRLGKCIRRALARFADAIIVYGEGGREQIGKIRGMEKRVAVARNTVLVPGYRNTVDDSKRYFLFVGRLQERKRIDLLIKAYAEYHRERPSPKYELVILGDGPERDQLKALVEDENIQHAVAFVEGTTDEKRLASIFSGALAYISPGDVGLGVLHAFAFGVPVVTSDLTTHGPEFENLKHDQNGLVLDLSLNVFSIAMLRLSKCRKYARRLGNEAFRTYEVEAHPDGMVAAFAYAVEGS